MVMGCAGLRQQPLPLPTTLYTIKPRIPSRR